MSDEEREDRPEEGSEEAENTTETVAGCPVNADGRVEYELEFPVEFKSTEYDVLHFRRINGSDLLATDGMGENAELITMIHRCAGVPRRVPAMLDGRDLIQINRIFQAFLGIGPTTGN